MTHHLGQHGAALYDAAPLGEVAVQQGEAAVLHYRVVGRMYDLPVHIIIPVPVEQLAQGAPYGELAVELEISPYGIEAGRDAPRVVIIEQIVLRRRLEARYEGHAPLHLVKIAQREFKPHAPCKGEAVHDEIGRRAGGRGVLYRVFKGFLRCKAGKGLALPDELHRPLAGVPRLAGLLGGEKRGQRRAEWGYPHRLAEDRHGVRRAVHRAGPARIAGVAAHDSKGLFVYFGRIYRPYRLLEVAGDVIPVGRLIGHHGPAGDEYAGQVEGGRRHEHTRDYLVARAYKHQPVEALGPCDRVYRPRDKVAGRQDVVHRKELGHAVADCGHVEFDRQPPRGPHPLLDVLGELPQGPVAGVEFAPRVGDAYGGLFDVLVPISAGVHQPDVVGVEPVGFGLFVHLITYHGRRLCGRASFFFNLSCLSNPVHVGAAAVEGVGVVPYLLLILHVELAVDDAGPVARVGYDLAPRVDDAAHAEVGLAARLPVFVAGDNVGEIVNGVGAGQHIPMAVAQGQARAAGPHGADDEYIGPVEGQRARQLGEPQVEADEKAEPAEIGVDNAALGARRYRGRFHVAEGVGHVYFRILARNPAISVDDEGGVPDLLARLLYKGAGLDVAAALPCELTHCGDIGSVHRLGVVVYSGRIKGAGAVVFGENHQVEARMLSYRPAAELKALFYVDLVLKAYGTLYRGDFYHFSSSFRLLAIYFYIILRETGCARAFSPSRISHIQL